MRVSDLVVSTNAQVSDLMCVQEEDDSSLVATNNSYFSL